MPARFDDRVHSQQDGTGAPSSPPLVDRASQRVVYEPRAGYNAWGIDQRRTAPKPVGNTANEGPVATKTDDADALLRKLAWLTLQSERARDALRKAKEKPT